MAQDLGLSKADIKNFIVLSAWIVELSVIVAVAAGWINPAQGSVQETLVRAMVDSFLLVTGLALGSYLWGKTKT